MKLKFFALTILAVSSVSFLFSCSKGSSPLIPAANSFTTIKVPMTDSKGHALNASQYTFLYLLMGQGSPVTGSVGPVPASNVTSTYSFTINPSSTNYDYIALQINDSAAQTVVAVGSEAFTFVAGGTIPVTLGPIKTCYNAQGLNIGDAFGFENNTTTFAGANTPEASFGYDVVFNQAGAGYAIENAALANNTVAYMGNGNWVNFLQVPPVSNFFVSSGQSKGYVTAGISNNPSAYPAALGDVYCVKILSGGYAWLQVNNLSGGNLGFVFRPNTTQLYCGYEMSVADQNNFCSGATPTWTNTPLATSTQTATNTGTSSFTPTVTNTTGASTSTSTNTMTTTLTSTPTNTAVTTSTSTSTMTNTDTSTPTNTAVFTATPTSTPTNTCSSTPTDTGVNTLTSTSTMTNTSSSTPTDTAGNTSTSTPTATNTSSSTPTNTAGNTSTATSTMTNTSSSTPTDTAANTSTASNTPTDTAVNTSTATNSSTDTSTSTNTPTITATNTSTPLNYVVTTFAGQAGVAGTLDGTGAGAQFSYPAAVAWYNGNIFVADYSNSTIRKISSIGVVSTFAGQAGVTGYTDATGTAAAFYHPMGLAVDSSGNIYVADFGNNVIRKITSGGVVSTLAGQLNGNSGSLDATGTSASFYEPTGVAVDSASNVYVTDYANCTIRKITSAGIVSTYAGAVGSPGLVNAVSTSAEFNYPNSLTLDPSGNVYVADSGNAAIRMIDTGQNVTTYAGTGVAGYSDGTLTAAQFSNPSAIVRDPFGNFYIADTGNQVIREIVNGSGLVSTAAGTQGNAGSSDGVGPGALFFGPSGVASDSTGNIFIADKQNDLIREMN